MNQWKLYQQHKAMNKKLYGKRYPLAEIKKLAMEIKKSTEEFHGRQESIASTQNSSRS